MDDVVKQSRFNRINGSTKRKNPKDPIRGEFQRVDRTWIFTRWESAFRKGPRILHREHFFAERRKKFLVIRNDWKMWSTTSTHLQNSCWSQQVSCLHAANRMKCRAVEDEREQCSLVQPAVWFDICKSPNSPFPEHRTRQNCSALVRNHINGRVKMSFWPQITISP